MKLPLLGILAAEVVLGHILVESIHTISLGVTTSQYYFCTSE
jgi:hypothetical protein